MVLLRQLEYLAALARERHFARAAQSCHVSQPSLSAGIRKLERELDLAIVRRGRRFEGFTPEGERVVRWAHHILAECAALHDDLVATRASLTGQLRVGAIPSALTVASLLTAPFCTEHPLARVSVESLPSRDIVGRLGEYDLDIGMTYLDGEPLGAVRTVPLYRERYLLLTPGAGEYSARTTVSWAEAARTPLCMLSPVMQNRRILESIFREEGLAVSPAVETDTVSALYAHVATQRWSSVIAHAWLYMLGVPPGMRVVPLDPPRRSPLVGLVLADRDPEPMLARALADTAQRMDMNAILEDVLTRHLSNATAPRRGF